MRRRGLVTQVAFASAVLGAALVAVFTLLVLAIHDLRDSSLKARHSQEAIAAANNAETLVIDLETGLRGYFITRDEKFLGPFNKAEGNLPSQLQRLMLLVADEPRQVQRVRLIRRGTNAYIHDYGATFIAFIEGNPQIRAADIIRRNRGLTRINKIRGWFDELIGAENKLAASRDASASTYAARATILGSTGAALALLLVLLFGMYIARRMVQPIRQTAEAAEGLPGGDHTSPRGVGGQGEERALGAT
jgi:CHASE3 domain sensor protein